MRDSIAANQPLAGALVQFVRQDARSDVRSTVTDSSGRFAISGLPTGRYLAGFFHPTLTAYHVTAPVQAVDVVNGRTITLTLSTPSATTLTAALCAGASHPDSTVVVLGMVQAVEDGHPLTGASVTLAWTRLTRVEQGGALLDEQVVLPTAVGAFLACGVPATDLAGGLTMRVTAPEHRSTQFTLVARPGTVVLRDVRLASAAESGTHTGGRIRGFVRRADGTPLPGATVVARDGVSAVTNATGAYTLSGAAPGTQSLAVRSIGYLPAERVIDVSDRGAARADFVLDVRIPILPEVTAREAVSGTDAAVRAHLGRQRRVGGGRVLMGADLTPLARSQSVAQFLERVPGARVVGPPGQGTVFLRDGCQPTLAINGRRLPPGAADVGLFLRPDEIIGIEIYPSYETVPAEFVNPGGPTACAIVFWTRRGP